MDQPPPTSTPFGTDVSVSILLGPASEITATDNSKCDDLVALAFNAPGHGRACVLGDLATVQRIVDEAAHQLMLVSTARAAAEEERGEQDRAHAKAHVAQLRDTIASERAEARAALG